MLAAHSVVAAGVTARQAMTFRETFSDPARILPHFPPERQCQNRNTRAEARAENRVILKTKLIATARVEVEERARVVQRQAAGL